MLSKYVAMSFLRLLFLLLLPVLAVAQKRLVFLGTYNWEKDKLGIYVYEITKGKLKKRSFYSGVLNPSFITLSPDGKYLYACIESKTKGAGGVAAFRVDATNARIEFINSTPSGGENPVYVQVHPEGRWLVNANYTEGSLSVYPILEGGAVGPFVQNLHFKEGSVHPKRQEASHVHAAIFSPEGTQLIAPDLGADRLRVFPFSANRVRPLHEEEELAIRSQPGTGPRHLIFHPSGAYAYCIEEMGGAVLVYSYRDGKIEELQRILTHEGRDDRNRESSDIQISPDGKYLYAGNRGKENNIVLFSVGSDGKLENLGYFPTHGEHPRTFAVDQDVLVVAHPVSGEVSFFCRNPEDGKLRKVGKKLKIPGVSTVQIRTYGL